MINHIKRWLIKRKIKRGRLKTIHEHAYTINEIAERLGFFPAEAEETVRDLEKQGKVQCAWHVPKKGDPILYILPLETLDIDEIKDEYEREHEHDTDPDIEIESEISGYQ